MLGDVGEHLLFSIRQSNARIEFVEQAAGRVHVAHEVAHVGEAGFGRGNNDAETGMHGLQLVVSNDHGHFDEVIDRQIEPRHLAVDPDKAVGR